MPPQGPTKIEGGGCKHGDVTLCLGSSRGALKNNREPFHSLAMILYTPA